MMTDKAKEPEYVYKGVKLLIKPRGKPEDGSKVFFMQPWAADILLGTRANEI